jgi:hypothetical protein
MRAIRISALSSGGSAASMGKVFIEAGNNPLLKQVV